MEEKRRSEEYNFWTDIIILGRRYRPIQASLTQQLIQPGSPTTLQLPIILQLPTTSKTNSVARG